MKILHVVSSVWRGGGGTSEVVPRLCRALKTCGHEVTLAVAHAGDISEAASKAIASGVEYRAFPRLRHPRELAISPVFSREVKPLIADADIIHLHACWMYPPWVAGWAAQRQGKPYLMMPHGSLNPEALRRSRWKKKIVGMMIERPLMRRADGIVATSESEAEGIRAYGVNGRIHIMPIGLDWQDIDCGTRNDCLLQKLGCDVRKKHLLYLSRISPGKGLGMLADAWGRINHVGWQLLIVGPDDRGYTDVVRGIYRDYIAEGSVMISGPIYGKDKFDLLKSADAFVLPTRSENWSIAVAEAMAARLPVVCTKGAPWDCIEKVNAGKWVDISSDGIAMGLECIMNLTDDERHSMGERGRMWVEQNLNWDVIVKNLVAFYEDVIEGRRALS